MTLFHPNGHQIGEPGAVNYAGGVVTTSYAFPIVGSAATALEMPVAGWLVAHYNRFTVTTATSGDGAFRILLDAVVQTIGQLAYNSSEGTGEFYRSAKIAHKAVRFTAGQTLGADWLENGVLQIDKTVGTLLLRFDW